MKNDLMFQTRTTCRSCGVSLEKLISFGDIPLSGKFFFSKEEASLAKKIPLTLCQCPWCKLIQIAETVDPSYLFEQYDYSSSSSPGLVKHFRNFVTAIQTRIDSGLIIDVGCNDGILLKQLPANYTRLGVDPSDIALVASEDFNLINKFLSVEIADEIVSLYGHPKLVTGSNVFAHIDDMHNILRAVCILNPTYFVVEVHYLGSLVSQMQYDFIYHEHLNYYSLESISNLLKQYNIGIEEYEFLPMHNGSIRLWCRPGSKNSELVQKAIIEENIDIRSFIEKVSNCRENITKFFNSFNGKLVCYGASARGVTLLNMSNVQPYYVVDNAPTRANKFLAGVGTPTYFPSHLVNDVPNGILVTAYNYIDDIKENLLKLNLNVPLYRPLPTIEVC